MRNGGQINKIYVMDCLEGMRTFLEDGEVDVVVTSPPYNIGKEYNVHNDNMPRDDYLEWLDEVFREIKRVLSPKGSFFLNIGYTNNDPWLAWDVARVAGKHFVLKNVIHWVKSISIDKKFVKNNPFILGDVSVGHYKPIRSNRYLSIMHEYIFHFTKTGDVPLDKLAIGVPYQDKSNITRWSTGVDLRDRGNVWFIPYKTIQLRERDRPHPAIFPPELPEMCIKLHGVSRVKLVLDPFMGLGNTAIAAIRLGVNFIGFDIDPYYVEIANRRIREEIRRQKLNIISLLSGNEVAAATDIRN